MRPQFSEFLEITEIPEYRDNHHSQVAGGQGERSKPASLARGFALLDNMRRPSHRHPIARPLSRLFGQSRRWCSAAVAVSMLFQALLPLLHQPQVAANADGIPAWIFASLCRGAAADVATIPADENQQPAPSTAPRCPVCLAAQLASLMLPPPNVAGVTLPIHGEAARFQDTTVAPVIAARILSPQARAPPSPV